MSYIRVSNMIAALHEQVNSAITAGQYWRLITPAFLHANLMHLAVNSYSLNSIGPAAELWCGPRRFAAVYGISAVAGTVASYIASPNPSVGASGARSSLLLHAQCAQWVPWMPLFAVYKAASMLVRQYRCLCAGAIFGIVGALAVFLQRNHDVFGARGDAVVRSLGQSMLLNIAFGAMTPSVDNWCGYALARSCPWVSRPCVVRR